MGSKAFCQDVNYHNLNASKGKESSIDMHFLSTILKLDLYSLVNKVGFFHLGRH